MIRETYVEKERGFGNEFGGKMGSRKTLWLTFVVTASLIAAGALYLLPIYL